MSVVALLTQAPSARLFIAPDGFPIGRHPRNRFAKACVSGDFRGSLGGLRITQRAGRRLQEVPLKASFPDLRTGADSGCKAYNIFFTRAFQKKVRNQIIEMTLYCCEGLLASRWYLEISHCITIDLQMSRIKCLLWRVVSVALYSPEVLPNPAIPRLHYPNLQVSRE